MKFTIRVIPNAKKNEIVSREGSFLKIKLTAVPDKGRANKAIIAFLAKEFDAPPSHITIIKGQTSREKVVEVVE